MLRASKQMTAKLNIQMALESVNPPVTITARDFFLRLIQDQSKLPSSISQLAPGSNCKICLLLTERYQSQKSESV